MANQKVTVRNNATGDVIAESSDPLTFEGNFYFDEKDVDMEQLEVTDRIYTCWYKGHCLWVDLKEKDGSVQENVAWLYQNPNPDYEQIKGKIGFWPTNQGNLVIEVSDPVVRD